MFSTQTFAQKESARAARLHRRTARIASSSWTLGMSQDSERGYSLTRTTRWRRNGSFGVDLPTPGNLEEQKGSFSRSIQGIGNVEDTIGRIPSEKDRPGTQVA